jgi:DNA polymerase-4
MVTTRRILHIDLDAFYCAVEERRDPNLNGKPFAVGGSPDQRGVVASCSYVARNYGVRSAMPMAQAVRICPELIIVRGHYREYSEASDQVMRFLKTITDQVEQISIDEAFLDITKITEPSQLIAERLQAQIRSELGLPCSIGIATNKLVAKMATNYGKSSAKNPDRSPNAIHIVLPGMEIEFLNPLPVEALWGVGPRTAEKLTEMGITTVGDILKIPESEMTNQFGKWGYLIQRRAKGIDERPISLKHDAKSVSNERTFAKDLRDEVALLENIQSLSDRVSKRLVKKHLQGTTIKIKLRWSDFTTITRQSTLNQPTNDHQLIFEIAKGLFHKEWRSGQPVRLIGVGVSGLTPEQLNLWNYQTRKFETKIDQQLSTAITDLREKFGDQVLNWGLDSNEENSKNK